MLLGPVKRRRALLGNRRMDPHIQCHDFTSKTALSGTILSAAVIIGYVAMKPLWLRDRKYTAPVSGDPYRLTSSSV